MRRKADNEKIKFFIKVYSFWMPLLTMLIFYKILFFILKGSKLQKIDSSFKYHWIYTKYDNTFSSYQICIYLLELCFNVCVNHFLNKNNNFPLTLDGKEFLFIDGWLTEPSKFDFDFKNNNFQKSLLLTDFLSYLLLYTFVFLRMFCKMEGKIRISVEYCFTTNLTFNSDVV